MKSVIYCLCVVAFFGASAWGKVRMPREVFLYSQLGAAKEEAQVSKKPIAFIYTDFNSSDDELCRATEAILRALKHKTILVYVPNTKGKPAYLKKAFRRGRYLPKVAVFDAKLMMEIGTVLYEEIDEEGDRDAFRTLKKSIKAYVEAQESL